MGVGENLSLGPRTPSKLYLPGPDLGHAHVTRAEDPGGVVQAFEAGVPPERVALDRRSDVLFALSKGGSAATRVELAGNEVTRGCHGALRIPGARAPGAGRAVRPGGRGGTIFLALSGEPYALVLGTP